MSEKQVGENYPPLHPRCRSTVAPFIEGMGRAGTRIAKVGKKTIEIPAAMKYKDYEKVYIKKELTLNEWNKQNRKLQLTSGDAKINGVNTIYANQVASHGGSGNIKVDDANYDHSGNPRKSEPFSIIDHKQANTGKVDKRAFYDSTGLVYLEIHSTNHGNIKNHPFGKSGEHAHDIRWKKGKPEISVGRELTKAEREDNSDIL